MLEGISQEALFLGLEIELDNQGDNVGEQDDENLLGSSKVEPLFKVMVGDAQVAAHQHKGKRDRDVALYVKAHQQANQGEQHHDNLLVAFLQGDKEIVVQDILEDGGVGQHAGVVFFVGRSHKVEQGRGRRTQNENLALEKSWIYTVLGDVVIGQVLENPFRFSRVVATLVIDLVMSPAVDGNLFHLAESNFFAFAQVVDAFFGGVDDVCQHVVVQDDQVGYPLFLGDVVMDVHVHGNMGGFVRRELL